MAGLTSAEAARRAGVDVADVEELVRLGIIRPASANGFSGGDVRRIAIIRMVQDSGLPLEGIAAGFQRGLLNLDFVDVAEYERIGVLSEETFRQAAERTRIPLELLTIVRESTGFGPARPDDLMREDEQAVLPFLEIQLDLGFDPVAIERLLRAMGDSTRRIAEAEAEWWRSQVTEPGLAAGRDASQLANPDRLGRLSLASETAMLAIFHAQQAQTWTSNIVAGFRYLLSSADLYHGEDRPPAICFLDITGYTRLTQERGDRAAAALAEQLARLVKRTSLEYRGRTVKWLGDGVMFYFRDPADGAAAALAMVDGVAAAGLPPAHVGLHAGPVVIQEGDYYGQTVNMAARIAEYARPGEVLVSQAVVDAADGAEPRAVTFSRIGNVELKGVAGPTELYVVRRAG